MAAFLAYKPLSVFFSLSSQSPSLVKAGSEAPLKHEAPQVSHHLRVYTQRCFPCCNLGWVWDLQAQPFSDLEGQGAEWSWKS